MNEIKEIFLNLGSIDKNLQTTNQNNSRTDSNIPGKHLIYVVQYY